MFLFIENITSNNKNMFIDGLGRHILHPIIDVQRILSGKKSSTNQTPFPEDASTLTILFIYYYYLYIYRYYIYILLRLL